MKIHKIGMHPECKIKHDGPSGKIRTLMILFFIVLLFALACNLLHDIGVGCPLKLLDSSGMLCFAFDVVYLFSYFGMAMLLILEMKKKEVR